MSNRLFQGIIHQMRDAVDRVIGVIDDNGVIIGMVLFYAVLTVTSVILGDVLMSVLDPRISFTAKAR